MVLGREYHCTTGCTWLLEKFHGIKLHAADVHMSKPTADWERVGDRFYRKIQVYTDVFDIDLELEHYDVSGAPFGGALALHRKDGGLYAYRGTDAARSSIDLYSCSGKLIRKLSWEKANIAGIGWSEDEALIVVCQDGTVRRYLELSDDFAPFSLGHGSEEHGVVDCRFWTSGFVALLGNNQLISVARYDEPRPKLLATPPSDEVKSWTIIPPVHTLSRSVEALLAIGQTINVVDASDSEDRMLQNGPFRHICVSPNGKFIALYTEDGKVWVISSDFQEKLSEYDSGSKVTPKDMQWCGNDAVVLAWEDEVHLVGPNGASSKFYYDSYVHIVPDTDGVRLLTNEVCDFLQNVPDVTEDTFKLGSTSPASVLLDCVELLEKRSPKADENLQMIKPNLLDAVSTCIAGAGHEFNINWQKQLLKAASFGKTVLELFDSDDFVTMTQTLRVLNAVRTHNIGFPLSYDQYTWLGPERLIRRLVARREYAQALRISDILRLPKSTIYLHWATQKVKIGREDDEALCQQVVRKVSGFKDISFEQIARAAHEEGRNTLATLILDHETSAAKQVPLLIAMEEDTVALDKAIDSGDTDLILFVLLQMKDKLPLATFFRTINTRPVATALFEETAMAQDRDLLKDLYYQDDRRLDGSHLLFNDALKQATTDAKVSKLRSAGKLVHESKELAFQARSMEELSKVLRLQDALNGDTEVRGRSTSEVSGDRETVRSDQRYSDQPLNHIVYDLITSGEHKRALKITQDFKLTERTFWHIRLRALIASRQWRELESLASSKKSPIGWDIFYNQSLAAGRPQTAGQFVAKCTDKTPQERGEMYEKCGLFTKAGEEALKAKDRPRLEELRERVTGREAMDIERLLGQLGKR